MKSILSATVLDKTNRAEQPYATFGPYKIYNVFGGDHSILRNKVVQFWIENKVLDESRAQQRAKELCIIATDKEGHPVGVTTVYVDLIPTTKPTTTRDIPHCVMRMFIQPKSRLPLFGVSLFNATYEVLNNSLPASFIAGLSFTAENAKLARPGMIKLFARHGFHPIGKTQQNQVIFNKPFSEYTVLY